MTVKRQLLCGVAVGAMSLVGEASYAQAQAPMALPAVFYWNGLYAGVHVGWGKARFRGTWFGDSGVTDFSHRTNGILGGVQVGQNWQQNTFVYGWEADLSFMNLKKSSSFSDAGSGDTLTTKLNLLGSLRGRLGVTVINPATLVYVTGGLAYAHGKLNANDAGTALSANFNKFGGVVGGGVEIALAQNWSWRAESLYYLINDSRSVAGPFDSATAKLDNIWVVRFGLNYRFGGT